MGMLIEGRWDENADSQSLDKGAFVRSAAQIRNWITPDGSAGPTGRSGYRAESGRYHLYAAWNCPWAHRALLTRALKQLTELISCSYAAPKRTNEGWVFDPASGFTDTLFGTSALHEIYSLGMANYSGRVTVPVLWDTETRTIVSNESADIVRMMNSGFSEIAPDTADFYPEHLREEIDRWNELIYRTLNNGVYGAGFARSQEAYDAAVADVFSTLGRIEDHLSVHEWLAGDTMTEADIRLFPTLVRFDVAYWSAFKCNLRRLVDYPNLWSLTKRIYAFAGVADTVKLEIYRRGYHSQSDARNPYGIVPLGPAVSFA